MEKQKLNKRWQLQDWLHMAVTMCLVVCLGVGGGLFYARDDCRCKEPLLEICGKSSNVCTPGAKGEQGKKGDNGAIGLSGPIGNAGRNGESGQKGKIGKTRYKRQCMLNGEPVKCQCQVIKGDSGEKGTKGNSGEKGTKGEKGTNIKSCPLDWKKYDGKCYRFLKCSEACSPHDARNSCKGVDGILTSVRSEKENTFISSLAGNSFLRMTTVILGGTDEDKEEQWVWPNNTELSYTNWNKGEPNNSGGQNCMVMKRNKNDKWDDVSCNVGRSKDNTGYVCERSMGK